MFEIAAGIVLGGLILHSILKGWIVYVLAFAFGAGCVLALSGGAFYYLSVVEGIAPESPGAIWAWIIVTGVLAIATGLLMWIGLYMRLVEFVETHR